MVICSVTRGTGRGREPGRRRTASKAVERPATPSPPASPVVGHLHQIARAGLIGHLLRVSRDFADGIFKLKFGSRVAVFVTDPDLTAELCDETRASLDGFETAVRSMDEALLQGQAPVLARSAGTAPGRRTPARLPDRAVPRDRVALLCDRVEPAGQSARRRPDRRHDGRAGVVGLGRTSRLRQRLYARRRAGRAGVRLHPLPEPSVRAARGPGRPDDPDRLRHRLAPSRGFIAERAAQMEQSRNTPAVRPERRRRPSPGSGCGPRSRRARGSSCAATARSWPLPSATR